jgi:hypothetical protein
MRKWWVLAVVAVTVSGCIRIRPEVNPSEESPPPSAPAPAAAPTPAPDAPAEKQGEPGSAAGYPDEAPAPQPKAAAPQEAGAAVTWGPMPAPVYPGAVGSAPTQRVEGGDKPTAYRTFHYSTSAPVARVLAFYRERLTDIQVLRVGPRVTIIKDLEKGNLVISLYQVSGRTEIDIQESQRLQPKKRGLFGLW